MLGLFSRALSWEAREETRGAFCLKKKKHAFYYKCIACLEIKKYGRGFSGGAVVENLPANAGDAGSSPGLGRSHMPRSN